MATESAQETIPAADNGAQGAAADVDNQSTADGAAAAGAAGEGSEEEEYEHYDLNTLGYNNFDDLRNDLQAKRQLEQQLQELQEYKNGPKFASERHKFIYDWAGQVEGMELDRARQLITICGADLNAMPDQQKRYEAFKLDPALKGLSRDEIKALFNQQEIELFGDPDDENVDPAAKKLRDIKAKQATAQATEKLSKIKQEWDSARTAVKAPEQTAQERQQFLQSLDGALSNYAGIPLKLRVPGQKDGEYSESSFNFEIDPSQMSRVREAMADPAGWWDRKLEESGTMANGDMVSMEKFADIISWYEFKEEILNSVYQQGREDLMAESIKSGRNLSKINEGASTGHDDAPKLTGQAAANKAFMQATGILK